GEVVSLRLRLDGFRTHVNSHLAESKFDISVSWLSTNSSRWCPCSRWITSLSLLCSHCRGSQSEIVRRNPPKADGLPPPPGLKPDISIRISGPDVRPMSPEVKVNLDSKESPPKPCWNYAAWTCLF